MRSTPELSADEVKRWRYAPIHAATLLAFVAWVNANATKEAVTELALTRLNARGPS